jgi:hypothetical protein
VRKLGFVLVLCAWVAPAAAKQRPLETQDPETSGGGHVLVEGCISAAHDVTYPQYGFKGDLWQLPVLGVDVGLSSIADLQITGGLYNYFWIEGRDPLAPVAGVGASIGVRPHSTEDIRIGARSSWCRKERGARASVPLLYSASERIAQERHRPGHD